MGKICITLLMMVMTFLIMPCAAAAQDDNPCAQFTSSNASSVCTDMVKSVTDAANVARDNFIKNNEMKPIDIPDSPPSSGMTKGQMMNYILPSTQTKTPPGIKRQDWPTATTKPATPAKPNSGNKQSNIFQ